MRQLCTQPRFRLRTLSVLALTGLLLSLMATSSACGDDKKRKRPGLGQPDRDGGIEAVPVEFVTLRSGRIEDTLRFSATLRAENQIQVLARTPGHVRKRFFEEGQKVAANQIMVRLESEEQSSAVRRTKVELAQAKRNLDKQKQLQKSGVVSTQSLENAQFEVERLTIARTDAYRALRYTTIRSPIAGTVTQRMVKRGDFVNPNQLLYEVTAFASLVAEVYVPEKDIARVVVGGTARLSGASAAATKSGAASRGRAARQGAMREGEVARIAPVVDPRTGTVKVTIALPVTAGLRPGMFVDVSLVVAQRSDAVLLPRRALVYDNDEPFAFKIGADEKVQRVRVQALVQDRENVEPATGFAAGDRVVVAGQIGLKDGAEVKARPAPDGARTAETAETVKKAVPAAEATSASSGTKPKAAAETQE